MALLLLGELLGTRSRDSAALAVPRVSHGWLALSCASARVLNNNTFPFPEQSLSAEGVFAESGSEEQEDVEVMLQVLGMSWKGCWGLEGLGFCARIWREISE